MEKRALRLQFAKEERTEPTLEKPSRKCTERQRKLNGAQTKIPEKKVLIRGSTNIPLKK